MPTRGPSRNELLEALETSRQLATITDLRALLNQIARTVTEVVGCARATVFAYDRTSDELCNHESRDAEMRFSSDRAARASAFASTE